jgi:dihydrofolate reductase
MKNNNVAVLLVAFSRVDCARQTFEAIKAAKPGKFYFYTNCPRVEYPEECANNQIIRDMVKEVDWPCELKTWFRDKPVSSLDSVRSAINWVFQNEEQAIVMEDDCVGAPAWFDFAAEMLERYKDDSRIWMIGGSNYAEQYNPHDYSYHFSRNFFINGWASWSNRWKAVDWDNLGYESMLQNGVVEAYYPTSAERRFHHRRLLHSESRLWDFAFWYTGMAHFAFSITPSRHLVQNIGWRGVRQGPLAKLRGLKLSIPFNPITYTSPSLDTSRPPMYVCPEKEFEWIVFKRFSNVMDAWYCRFPRWFYHTLIKKKNG